MTSRLEAREAEDAHRLFAVPFRSAQTQTEDLSTSQESSNSAPAASAKSNMGEYRVPKRFSIMRVANLIGDRSRERQTLEPNGRPIYYRIP
jgi:hypothetical protein